MNESATAINQSHRFRYAFLWMGWLVPQLLLLGPCLLGFRVLVPCGLLATPGFYLPVTTETATIVPGDAALTDLVLIYPMVREFCAAEFRAGRIPHWQSTNFCGTPFVWPKYSPFELPYNIFPNPSTLAWMQLLQSLCVGTGMWFFLTRSLGFQFWPAATISWCIPWIGYLTVWQGFPLTAPVCLLPWLLWSVDVCVRRPFSLASLSAGLVTAILLVSGAPDIAGLVLLTSGLRFVWGAVFTWTVSRHHTGAVKSAICMSYCWILGFMLAAPFLLPFVEFARTGSRMNARAEGLEERPPIGLHALPALVLPEIHGGSRRYSPYIGFAGNLLESSAGGYAGLLLVFWLVPLSFSNRERRGEALFWVLLAVISIAWTLKLPGIISFLRLPVLNMLSHNRWVFATAFSFLMLACIALENLQQSKLTFRGWFIVPMVATAILAFWCFSRASDLPEPLKTQLPNTIRAGLARGLTPADLPAIRQNFELCYLTGGLAALLAFVGWIVSIQWGTNQTAIKACVSLFLVGELFLFAVLQTRQAARELYYPRVPALEYLAQMPEGRILGLMCLPPNLNQTHGLRDVRGYDAIDTRPIIKLLNAVRDSSFESPVYASTQWFMPAVIQGGDGLVRLPPILSMLNTRYLLLRSEPSVDWPVVFQRDDYWVIENKESLPAIFVPEQVRRATDDEETLRIMSMPSFQPQHTAFVHSEIEPFSSAASGVASIVTEAPGEIEILATMDTDGLVVISNLWDPGWAALIDGMPSEVIRTNFAIQSVRVPAGEHRIQLRFRPVSLPTSLWLSGIAFSLITIQALLLSGRAACLVARCRKTTNS